MQHEAKAAGSIQSHYSRVLPVSLPSPVSDVRPSTLYTTEATWILPVAGSFCALQGQGVGGWRGCSQDAVQKPAHSQTHCEPLAYSPSLNRRHHYRNHYPCQGPLALLHLSVHAPRRILLRTVGLSTCLPTPARPIAPVQSQSRH